MPFNAYTHEDSTYFCCARIPHLLWLSHLSFRVQRCSDLTSTALRILVNSTRARHNITSMAFQDSGGGVVTVTSWIFLYP